MRMLSITMRLIKKILRRNFCNRNISGDRASKAYIRYDLTLKFIEFSNFVEY